MSIVERLLEAQRQLDNERTSSSNGDVNRELSLAITHVEDAIMRTNRAFAKLENQFAVADIQAEAEQERTL